MSSETCARHLFVDFMKLLHATSAIPNCVSFFLHYGICKFDPYSNADDNAIGKLNVMKLKIITDTMSKGKNRSY